VRRDIAARLGSLIAVVLALTFAVFLVQTVLPADPIRVFFGRNASPELIAEKRAELGYDQPIIQQYLGFLGRLASGDLGDSLQTRRPVTSDLAIFLPATFELALVAAILAGLGGLVLGVSAQFGSAGPSILRTLAVTFSSAPSFLLGILGVLFFYRRLDWLPAGGRSSITDPPDITGFYLFDSILSLDPAAFWDGVVHLIMPATILAVGPAVAIGRTLRATLASTLETDHIRSARAMGLPQRRIIARHGLRNSLGPVLSVAGLQFGLLIAGAVVVEMVFSWPGVGLYLSQAIQISDFPAVVGVVLVLAITYVIVNAVVDILQLVADPRQRERQ
jgi:peptide/nickel transport system permease protein